MNSLAGAVVLTKTGGILGPIAGILGWIMDLLFRFTSTFGIENIGLCIILFTLVTKLLMMPLTIKQQKSSKLMAVMQPEINAIQKKYKGKENDQKSAMMMQAEMKAVYEKYGTSMTGGCLPAGPVLFVLWHSAYRNYNQTADGPSAMVLPVGLFLLRWNEEAVYGPVLHLL